MKFTDLPEVFWQGSGGRARHFGWRAVYGFIVPLASGIGRVSTSERT